MKLRYNGEVIEANAENTVILHYPNDIMNGLYVDMDDTYCFVHADAPGYYEAIHEAIAEGVAVMAFNEEEATLGLSDVPTCYVVSSLQRFLLATVEEMVHGNP